MTTTVYVLKCTNNKYYVGKTTRSVNTRFEEHRNGHGSEWTRLYRPIRIVESEQTNNSHLELNKTLDCMNRYGIDNVRGSCYSNVNLSETERQHIRQLLSTRNDSCFNCGMTDHFANDCVHSGTNNNNPSHFANEHDNNDSSSSYDGNDDDDDDDNPYRCFKCGSPNHFANECDDDGDDNPYRCFRCGSPSHFANDCDKEFDDSYSDDSGRLDSIECYRCGRNGHYANQCRNVR